MALVDGEMRVSKMPPVVRTRLDHVCGRHFLTVVLTAAQALRCLIDHVAIAPPIVRPRRRSDRDCGNDQKHEPHSEPFFLARIASEACELNPANPHNLK